MGPTSVAVGLCLLSAVSGTEAEGHRGGQALTANGGQCGEGGRDRQLASLACRGHITSYAGPAVTFSFFPLLRVVRLRLIFSVSFPVLSPSHSVSVLSRLRLIPSLSTSPSHILSILPHLRLISSPFHTPALRVLPGVLLASLSLVMLTWLVCLAQTNTVKNKQNMSRVKSRPD